MAQPNPVYVIAQLTVNDYTEYRDRYVLPVLPIFQRLGVEVLAASIAPGVIEGPWAGNWTVILRFPDPTAVSAWYDAPEYQSLKQLRVTTLTKGGSLVSVEAFNPAAFGL